MGESESWRDVGVRGEIFVLRSHYFESVCVFVELVYVNRGPSSMLGGEAIHLIIHFILD